MGHWSPDALAAVVVGTVYLANALGLLERLGFKNRNSADAAGELDIADRKIERLERELAEWKANTPIFEMLAKNTDTQLQILDRLAHHNGSFKHVEEALGQINESFKLMTGFISGLHDLQMKESRT